MVQFLVPARLGCKARSSLDALEQIDKFGEFHLLSLPIAGGDSIGYAMSGMVLEDFALGLAQRCLDRLHLVQDVDAIAILFHHTGYAAHLAFDPVQAIEQLRCVLGHQSYPTVEIP